MIRLYLLFLLLFTPAFAQKSAPPIAKEARLSGDTNRTRLIIDLERTVDMRAFLLADPARVVIDLDEVNFQLPALTGQTGRGLVTAWRYGLFAANKSRIVIDLSSLALIDKAFMLEAVDQQPARLVIDLVKSDAAKFNAALSSPQGKFVQNTLPVQPPRLTPDPADTRPVIVIDAGHGGIDTGAASANGQQEKVIVLNFALKLKEKLEVTQKYRIVMTRNDDTFVPLGERVKLSREAKAALFISIHADSVATNGENVRGASIYTLSETASDADAARLAEKENKADAIAGIDLKDEPNEVADILIELTQRETRSFSNIFQKSLVDYMKSATRMHKDPTRAAALKVLRAHDVPSVLVELGYMSNSQDLSQLTNEAWRDRTSEAMSKAIEAYFKAK
jgi:N-acetylmuramoyl-L-alanine amidase